MATLQQHPLRFLDEHQHLTGAFGADSFGRRAESVARFFGTPVYLVGQSAMVGTWVVLNATHVVRFDLYPFILLNLAFSLQAAYAAPLILLAQTRQADRDKAHAEADAQHREAIAEASLQRQELAEQTTASLRTLIEQNTALTEETRKLAAQVDELTRQIHSRVVERRA